MGACGEWLADEERNGGLVSRSVCVVVLIIAFFISGALYRASFIVSLGFIVLVSLVAVVDYGRGGPWKDAVHLDNLRKRDWVGLCLLFSFTWSAGAGLIYRWLALLVLGALAFALWQSPHFRTLMAKYVPPGCRKYVEPDDSTGRHVKPVERLPGQLPDYWKCDQSAVGWRVEPLPKSGRTLS